MLLHHTCKDSTQFYMCGAFHRHWGVAELWIEWDEWTGQSQSLTTPARLHRRARCNVIWFWITFPKFVPNFACVWRCTGNGAWSSSATGRNDWTGQSARHHLFPYDVTNSCSMRASFFAMSNFFTSNIFVEILPTCFRPLIVLFNFIPECRHSGVFSVIADYQLTH